jgi:3-oxoacyl-[acyl-carrier protein] reductase
MTDQTKTALITGGANGIGAATAALLKSRGWHVAIVDLSAKHSTDADLADPGAIVAMRMDVRARETARIACDVVMQRWGRLDLLVNNAGVNRHSPLESFSLEDWHLVLDVSLTSTLLFMQSAASHMLKAGRGSIVNTASIAASRGVAGRAAYAAAKAAIISLTKSGAVEWATRGIRVNAIAPGFTETAMVRNFIDDGSVKLEPMIERTPMRRLAQPDEIARVTAFLGGEESTYITGHVLYVDGGFTADYGIPSLRHAGQS